MPYAASSAYTPAPSRPRPAPVRLAGPQYRVVSHTIRPPNKRSRNGRHSPERNGSGARARTFFSRPPGPATGRLPQPTTPAPPHGPVAETCDAPSVPDGRTGPDLRATAGAILAGGSESRAKLGPRVGATATRRDHPWTGHALPCQGPPCLELISQRQPLIYLRHVSRSTTFWEWTQSNQVAL